jgi:magnesium chelatase subunit H
MRFVFLTIDATHTLALREAVAFIRQRHDIDLTFRHVQAPDLNTPDAWSTLARDIGAADFVFGSMLFGEEYVRPLAELLASATCPVCIIMSNPALIQCTRLGKFSLQPRSEDQQPGMLKKLMQSLRPRHGQGEGQRQLALVRGISGMLKYIPGKAQDLHSYISIHQFWTHSSPENLYRMLCMLIGRYIPTHKGKLPVHDPLIYPDTALVHPEAPEPFVRLSNYQKWQRSRKRTNGRGTVGLLSLRATVLSRNTGPLDALVRALESRGLDVRLAYSAGLDGRAAVQEFFLPHAKRTRQPGVDLLVTTTGFALVGGPAASHPAEARAALEELDVAYLDMIPLVFQRVDEWQHDDRGLAPMHLAMNVALPELDSAVEPLVYGGPGNNGDPSVPLPAQIELAAERIARRIDLRRKPNAEKKLAVVLFSFPPTLGNVGTAAYLDVFASIYRLLCDLRDAGYTVEVPESADALRQAVVDGNALAYGTDGNVAAHFPVDDYRRLFPASREIDPLWGRAPGELLNDGKNFFILGRYFGNVFVGIQPSFGYERDPMRLLMAKDAAPHHGFAAFYTWLNHVYGADAVLHFGTHGALEFMPGKQAGLSHTCWPARLLGNLPNLYYYCVNNPSEGTIARRRSAATLVSYMVPPVQQAGLYKGLRLLKDALDRYRQRPDTGLLDDIRTQAEQLGISPEPTPDDDAYVAALAHELLEVEQRMIPVGLHVLGQPPAASERTDILALVAAFARPDADTPPLPHLVAQALGHRYDDLLNRMRHDATAQAHWQQIDDICREAVRLLVEHNGQPAAADHALHQATGIAPGRLTPLWEMLADLLARIEDEREVAGLLHALEGGYIAPSPGNDVVRNQAVVPTGRNIHGLDPYHMPTPGAQASGARLVDDLLEQTTREQGAPPETVALVLWGTDNLKTDGEGVAQVLALLGARAVTDELGQISSVALLPLAELGRPRYDVVVTVSGIFRDLFTHQMGLLDRAVRLAAQADEPLEQNFVRKHALAQADELGISLEEAAARVFSNAPGSYGANVNHLVDSSTWEDEQQISDTFLNRKGFAFGPGGTWSENRALMERALSTVDVTFQNVDSIELGISDIDHYYEYLGGVTKSVERVRGRRPPVLVSEAFATTSGQRVRSLEQMVRLESRAKLLNPKWYEGMLAHGYEGVHEIEARTSNTYGWSATAGAVEGWVYQGVADTYLLDEQMRERLAALNPHATAAMTRRLLEASSRGYWEADEDTLEALRRVYDDLEDRLEGVSVGDTSS